LKKRTKKLFSLRPSGAAARTPIRKSLFASFSLEKEVLNR
jgi:hypothetical protein